MRVAFFGGSFDPPHRAHAAIARAAADTFLLDLVLIVPTGRQPMKPFGASASYMDRLAMCSRMCSADPRFEVSALDAPRPDGVPNYTVDTLRKLHAAYPSSAEIYALVGADSFVEIPRWHDAQTLIGLAEWIVVSRPSFSLHDANVTAFLERTGARMHYLSHVSDGTSATELRQRLREGEDCPELLAPGVASYIRTHHLYSQSKGGITPHGI